MIAGIERLLVVAQRAVVGGNRNSKTGRQIAFQQAGTLELVEARQVAHFLQPEMRQKRLGGAVGNRPAERIVGFYIQRGTAEQWIKEGKNAIKWTRLSCRTFAANAVRLQLHALAYNLANFMRTLAMPEAVKQWSLTSLREKLVKIGAEVVRHCRYGIWINANNPTQA
jgi:hypothetical protein